MPVHPVPYVVMSPTRTPFRGGAQYASHNAYIVRHHTRRGNVYVCHRQITCRPGIYFYFFLV